MKTKMTTRLTALFLAAVFCFACAPMAAAAQTDGFRCEKTAQRNEDGTVTISLRAFQTGSVPAADIVMVLDVSGSMENSTPISVSEIDSTKDYYVLCRRVQIVDGKQTVVGVKVRVHNTAPAGAEPTWFGQLKENGPQQQVIPGDGENGTYQFYTGAMDALRAAAKDFIHAIAQNAAQYEADHRIAVVEFSCPEPKGADALCTSTNPKQPVPYYANILTGTQTAAGALVSAKDSEQTLSDVITRLTAAGPTYSNDAMTQAKRILSSSTASRRTVILFTDGGPGSYGWNYDEDNSAFRTANGAIAAAAEMKQSGVQIYTIGVFNEENLSGTAGENNRTYLSLVSSNYPNAESMDAPGTQQADGYCSIGDLHMDLTGAFKGISAVLGEPVESAQVRDTVSKYFYLTDAQRQALLEAYPQAQIVDNDDGTTTVSLDSVDFPPVAIHPNGEIVDENDAGVFTMTFDVTPRDGFLGGDGVSTNSGLCGVYADGLQIGQFETPSVNVPVNETALGDLLTVQSQTVYAYETLPADALYTDLSDSPLADYADLSYEVTGPDGAAVNEVCLQTAGEYAFAVTMTAVIADSTYTQQKAVNVTVLEDTVKTLEMKKLPDKTKYMLGERVSLDGIELNAGMNSGRTLTPTTKQLSVSPETLNTAGMQTVTVSFGGKTVSFDVTVEPYTPTLSVKTLPEKTSYFVGETLDTAGLTLLYTDEYNERTVLTDGFVCTPTTLAKAGTHTITASFGGMTATFRVTVQQVKADKLVIVSPPRNTSFTYTKTPDFSGLSVYVHYNNGDEEIIDDLSRMSVQPDNARRVRRGTQQFRVTACGVSDTFDMQVRLEWWQWLILICLFGWIWY